MRLLNGCRELLWPSFARCRSRCSWHCQGESPDGFFVTDMPREQPLAVAAWSGRFLKSELRLWSRECHHWGVRANWTARIIRDEQIINEVLALFEPVRACNHQVRLVPGRMNLIMKSS
jgi:hypothetical protein